MVKSLDDLRSLQEEDWVNLKIPPFHKRKILEVLSQSPKPIPITLQNPCSSSREDRRRDTGTNSRKRFPG